jgi:D-3-phosphoglycerate dehydrogenase / 2-oxoglutarate reductase
MAANTKRIFCVRKPYHAIFSDIIAQRGDVVLDQVDGDSSYAMAASVLSTAHAYQVGASRDEIAARYHVTPQLLEQTPNLLIVSSSGAGYDPVDVTACTKAGVIVVNQAGGNARSVAEHVIGFVLALSKRMGETDRALRRGVVTNRNDYMGQEVEGKTIGIVGFGHVGQKTAALAGGVLGMKVLAHDPYVAEDLMAKQGVAKVPLDALLQQADFVSVNCPLNAETRGMIGAREFALMKPTAYFITTARGFIHDEAALADALAAKAIAGAGLDVWTKEPPLVANPLLAFDSVIASAHTAGVTHEARRNMGKIAAEQLIVALDGKRPPRLINPDAWPLFSKRFEKAFGHRPEAV